MQEAETRKILRVIQITSLEIQKKTKMEIIIKESNQIKITIKGHVAKSHTLETNNMNF